MCDEKEKRPPVPGEAIRRMLSLRNQEMTKAMVARTLEVTPPTVARRYAKADELGLTWAAAKTMTNDELERIFNGKTGPRPDSSFEIDMEWVA